MSRVEVAENRAPLSPVKEVAATPAVDDQAVQPRTQRLPTSLPMSMTPSYQAESRRVAMASDQLERLAVKQQELQLKQSELRVKEQELQLKQSELRAKEQELQSELRVKEQELQSELRVKEQELQSELRAKQEENRQKLRAEVLTKLVEAGNRRRNLDVA
eukprot:jgi/Phyca11/19903/fgenesh1_pg.PHYCAscaffold_53_\